MPLFAYELLKEVSRTDCSLQVKIFILKIVVNDQALFKPYAHLWVEPVCNFITLKQNGGSGFHYFLRDLCTMLV